MVVEVDIAVLQTWITIGLTSFGGICTLTAVGIRIITKPMTTALKELNTTVKEINAESIKMKQEVNDIKTIHRMRGCDQPIEGE